MIIYNVTVKADHAIAADWLQWLKEEHIPEMIATGCFTTAQVMQLLETDESDGLTYAVQYRADTIESYYRYVEEFSKEMRKKGFDKWGNKFTAFRSVMKVVN